MTVKLETKHLTIAFGGLVAVDDLNLSLHEGEILGLIGPNGAGKTTVFNLLTGVYKPTRGEVIFNGNPIHQMAPHKVVGLGIARTFQNIRLFSTLSVLENVMVGHGVQVRESVLDAILLSGRKRRQRKQWIAAAEEILEYVGLRDAADDLATDMPYGRQRMVEIARALATGCEVLLLDEPSAGMNQVEKKALMTLIYDIRDRLKKTILIIEHDMKVLMNLVDRIVVLDYGKQIAEGLPEQIKNNPLVIDAYLGGMDDTVEEALGSVREPALGEVV